MPFVVPHARFRSGRENARSSAWSKRSAPLLSLTVNGTTPQFTGVLEHAGRDLLPAGYATCLDVTVDFSQTSLAKRLAVTTATVYIALYAQCLGIQKYRAQFGLNPTTGSFVSSFPSGTSENGEITQDGDSFLVQARGTAALVWGIQIGIAGSTPGFNVSSLFVTSICHGIERSP